ncbi:IS5 family transposase [Paracoccus sp. MC1854]|uniref:IS5 family transposase n=1 Tax=Paracoccus sp. MC1854 TaxID=2760306 RepID=UPI00351C6E69
MLLEQLADAGYLDWSRASLDSAAVPAKRGCRDRPEPDGSRAESGTKRLSVVDRKGTPLGVRLSPVNRRDSRMMALTLDALPGVRHGHGRPRKRLGKLHADKTYDQHRCRSGCRKRRIMPRIARRGMDHSERLGRHHRVVERTLAWLNRFRRLIIRYEQRADIHEDFVLLGCALICLNQIRRFC